ncbi:ABC transporter ATP-binding protein, partial [Aeromonas enteropelogenes]
DDFSLALAAGDIACLFGPSGCGKTTVLRAIAGFEPVRAGSIRLGDALLSSSQIHLPPEQRRVGMMFQEYALFPHLSVLDNVAYGLKLRKVGTAERRQRAQELLDIVGLGDFSARAVAQLSGGQQQRVALARALAMRPRVLLLDEPVAGMNREETEDMARFILDVQEEWGVTVLLVEHDMGMVMDISSHVVVLNFGQVIASGTPAEVRRHPQVIEAYLGAESEALA